VKKILSLALVFLAFAATFAACKNSPTTPDHPTSEYLYNVQVTYTRDVTKIRNPEGNDAAMYLFGELNDPQQNGYQKIGFQMTKIAENQFTCTIPKIWVNSYGIYHVVKVQEPKMSIPGGEYCTAYTGENINIPGAYSQSIVPSCNGLGSELRFMIK
jgi:hypothetical protein